MIIQIDDNKTLVDLSAMNALPSPQHGDHYYIISEDTCYMYNDFGNGGSWSRDDKICLFVVHETLQAGHTDFSGIEMWHTSCHRLGADYLTAKNGILTQLVVKGGFSNLTDTEKDILGYYNLDDGSNIVPFYMGYYSEGAPEASYRHLQRSSVSISNNAKACSVRSESPRLIEIILAYLTPSDATTFLESTQSFDQAYKSRALFGTQYGDSSDGIMDYIESTGSYIGAGLSNYTVTQGTLQNLIDALKTHLTK